MITKFTQGQLGEKLYHHLWIYIHRNCSTFVPQNVPIYRQKKSITMITEGMYEYFEKAEGREKIMD